MGIFSFSEIPYCFYSGRGFTWDGFGEELCYKLDFYFFMSNGESQKDLCSLFL